MAIYSWFTYDDYDDDDDDDDDVDHDTIIWWFTYNKWCFSIARRVDLPIKNGVFPSLC